MTSCEDFSSQHGVQAFNYSKRRMVVGQWIDVKDTIDQWLEATILEIKDDQIYVHYNGWAPRWDEWILLEQKMSDEEVIVKISNIINLSLIHI